jgi:hypothetical protein
MLLVENIIQITTSVSEGRGKRGDRIRLVNLSSKKEVYGKVMNTSTVQIDFNRGGVRGEHGPIDEDHF